MNIWEYGLLFFSVFAGGVAAFSSSGKNNNWNAPLLSFSGSFLLGLAILHLFPSVFSEGNPTIGLWVLSGFMLQFFLEQLTSGIEHGHIHSHTSGRGLRVFPIMIGLSIHAFIEGLPLAHYHELIEHSSSTFNHLLYGIVLHKLPAAFALGTILSLAGTHKWALMGYLFIFATMSPLGSWLSHYLHPEHAYVHIIMALVAGSFLHIATTILFETDQTAHHTLSLKKLLFILSGLLLAIITIL
jgi:zinc transporter ZupT